MNDEGINFPQYRKYKNGKSYFKIINPRSFEEVQLIGSKRIVRETVALRYPEITFITDLLLNYSEMAEKITEAEYLSIKK